MSTCWYLDEQQQADYQEGRRARLAREQDAALAAIDRLSNELATLTDHLPMAGPTRISGDELVRLCAALAAESAVFRIAQRDRAHDAPLVEGP